MWMLLNSLLKEKLDDHVSHIHHTTTKNKHSWSLSTIQKPNLCFMQYPNKNQPWSRHYWSKTTVRNTKDKKTTFLWVAPKMKTRQEQTRSARNPEWGPLARYYQPGWVGPGSCVGRDDNSLKPVNLQLLPAASTFKISVF